MTRRELSLHEAMLWILGAGIIVPLSVIALLWAYGSF
jgi:hypothetical protein